MKIILENQEDKQNADVLLNWLDIALKAVGGKNGAAQAFVYFEQLVLNSIAEFDKQPNEKILLQEEK